MKHVRDWGDLRQFGIDMLTGEACALSTSLVDVTERGGRSSEPVQLR